jgi:hypothetical protein
MLMHRFCVYISDEPSGVTDIEEVWCASDDEAITMMLDLAGRNAAEVWQGDERIYAVPPAAQFAGFDHEPGASEAVLRPALTTPLSFYFRVTEPRQI